MIKTILLAAMFIGLAGVTTAFCLRPHIKGSGVIVKVRREIVDVQNIDLTAPAQVFITQGDIETLEIETDDNLAPHFISTVENGTLKLGWRDGAYSTSSSLILRVSVKTLRNLRIAGAGQVIGKTLEVEALVIILSGAAKIELGQLEAKALDLNGRGSGLVAIGGGKVEQQRIKLTGLASYQAVNMASQAASVKIMGSAQAALSVTEKLTYEIIGSGKLDYKGDPETNGKILGLCLVNKLDEHT